MLSKRTGKNTSRDDRGYVARQKLQERCVQAVHVEAGRERVSRDARVGSGPKSARPKEVVLRGQNCLIRSTEQPYAGPPSVPGPAGVSRHLPALASRGVLRQEVASYPHALATWLVKFAPSSRPLQPARGINSLQGLHTGRESSKALRARGSTLLKTGVANATGPRRNKAQACLQAPLTLTNALAVHHPKGSACTSTNVQGLEPTRQVVDS